jgi:hypothetical protein
MALIGGNMTEEREERIIQNLETLRTAIFEDRESVERLIKETIHLVKNDRHRAKRRRIQNTFKQRNRQIFEDRLNGLKYKNIAKRHSLSEGRCRQIFERTLRTVINSREIKKILLPNDTQHWDYKYEYWQNNKEILLGYFDDSWNGKVKQRNIYPYLRNKE